MICFLLAHLLGSCPGLSLLMQDLDAAIVGPDSRLRSSVEDVYILHSLN